jgi:2-polyprenyl-3-methyl-5-hydroxy-6-metoxy-1,4-benzoquinol methylase
VKPIDTGKNYDTIAKWWQNYHKESTYGLHACKRALSFVINKKAALDIGCGAGGRFVYELEKQGFSIQGIDISNEMITLASSAHPKHDFLQADICEYAIQEKFDFIIAWDSLFHLPLAQQKPVLNKLCQALAKDGILVYSFGNAQGEHIDQWHERDFYYSSIGINDNLNTLIAQGLAIMHLEIDDESQKHVFVVAKKADSIE